MDRVRPQGQSLDEPDERREMPGTQLIAVEPIHALVVRCDGFDRLMNDDPSVRHEILSALTRRIRN